MDPYTEFVEYVVKSIVDYPEDVHVEKRNDDMGILVTLSVHKADMGRVVGRLGNTAKSIRDLVRALGMKNQARVSLKILEPADK